MSWLWPYCFSWSHGQAWYLAYCGLISGISGLSGWIEVEHMYVGGTRPVCLCERQIVTFNYTYCSEYLV